MGYACPVCDDPQRDAEHLANHLAFQAMTHGDDHETWLDDHAPGWVDGGPADLAPRLAELADEADYEVVFEDTTPETRDDGEVYDPDLQGAPHAGTDHAHGHSHHADNTGGGVDRSELDPEIRTVVEEARELTREMLDESDEDGDGE